MLNAREMAMAQKKVPIKSYKHLPIESKPSFGKMNQKKLRLLMLLLFFFLEPKTMKNPMRMGAPGEMKFVLCQAE